MRNPTIFIALATAGACAFAAINLPKEGNYNVVACWTGTSNDIEMSKDYTAGSYEMIGTVVSAVPGGLGDQSTFRCVGVRSAIKGRQGGSNLCEVVDADGDKRMTRFEIGGDGSVVRETIGGTGKYEGITMTATVAMMPPMKESKPGVFQGCNRQTGTYKLK